MGTHVITGSAHRRSTTTPPGSGAVSTYWTQQGCPPKMSMTHKGNVKPTCAPNAMCCICIEVFTDPQVPSCQHTTASTDANASFWSHSHLFLHQYTTENTTTWIEWLSRILCPTKHNLERVSTTITGRGRGYKFLNTDNATFIPRPYFTLFTPVTCLSNHYTCLLYTSDAADE